MLLDETEPLLSCKTEMSVIPLSESISAETISTILANYGQQR